MSHRQEETARLVERHTPLVWSIVRRFTGRGVEIDDLFQLGVIGLLKAIEGYDERLGHAFSTYAVPKIMGEIRRFLRDDGTVKVSRVLRERAAQVGRIHELFVQIHGREPTLSELAEQTGLTLEEVAECTGAGQAVLSLDAPLGEEGEGTLLDLQHDPYGEERLLERIDLKSALALLAPLEQQLIALRYSRGLTQQKTAEILGLTQVRVSRMEKKILAELRQKLIG